jgi:hypothetical protein
MAGKINFWETKEWIELKTSDLKTDKLLSKVEYLRLVGAKNFTEESYRKYLETFTQEKTELNEG